MAEAEVRAVLLVVIGGGYFFLVLPLMTFHLRRVLRGPAMAVFLGAVGVWFLAHFLLALGSPWVGGLLVLSAAAMGVAILDLGRQYARLVAAPPDREGDGAGPPP